MCVTSTIQQPQIFFLAGRLLVALHSDQKHAVVAVIHWQIQECMPWIKQYMPWIVYALKSFQGKSWGNLFLFVDELHESMFYILGCQSFCWMLKWKKNVEDSLKKKMGFNIKNPPTSFCSTAFKSSTTGINRYMPKAGSLTN